MIRRKIIALILLLCTFSVNLEVLAAETKYPDYTYEFLGNDRFENYSRKMFNFNLGLNKYCIKPVHILWASLIPQYGMDRIFGFSNNIEYPIRLVSSLVQRDFHNAGNETKRFFINTTIGLAGMFDPAKRFLKIERSRDNMDKALARCNIKSGAYFVLPVINFTTVRGLFGRAFDMALNPSTYIGSPVIAVIKAVIVINRTSYLQSIVQLIESNFVDPYYITKLAFGLDGFIKKNNYDRVEVLSKLQTTDLKNKSNNVKSIKNQRNKNSKAKLAVSAKLLKNGAIYNNIENPKNEKIDIEKVSIKPDLHLKNYAPQSPVVDSMRTFLFELPEATDSMWNELSPWNCSFANRFKVSSVNIVQGRKNYTFKYRLQKNKNAPLAIIYPSTGDGVNANHPIMFAKLFYDAGYSVLIQGNPFQWEFVQSMPENYRPGLPAKDALMMKTTTEKILQKLQKKHGHTFENKVVLGTSLAALDILYMAEQESKNNKLEKTQYIAICPPIDLVYSLEQIDNYSDEWTNYSENLKEKVAFAAAKLVKLYQSKGDIKFTVNHLPFDEDEAKIFTTFIMHQKLANVVFTLENAPTNKKSDVYNKINDMSFFDYFAKYIVSDSYITHMDLENGIGIKAISHYLKNSNNYKIYHTRNDYLINQSQLKYLRYLTGSNLTIIDNGAHMGFLYRPEFIRDLSKTIIDMKSGKERI